MIELLGKDMKALVHIAGNNTFLDSQAFVVYRSAIDLALCL